MLEYLSLKVLKGKAGVLVLTDLFCHLSVNLGQLPTSLLTLLHHRRYSHTS